MTKNERDRKYYSQNPKAKQKKARAWYAANKDRVLAQKRVYHLNKKYGITPEEYQRLFNKQKGYCAICKRHQSDLKEALSVDHNHETGEIRGLLCPKCNKAIGLLDDSSDLIKRASRYVKANGRNKKRPGRPEVRSMQGA